MAIIDPLQDGWKITHSTTVSEDETELPSGNQIITGSKYHGAVVIGQALVEGPNGAIVKAQVWGYSGPANNWGVMGDPISLPVRAIDSGEFVSYYQEIYGHTIGITFIDIPAGCFVRKNYAQIADRAIMAR